MYLLCKALWSFSHKALYKFIIIIIIICITKGTNISIMFISCAVTGILMLPITPYAISSNTERGSRYSSCTRPFVLFRLLLNIADLSQILPHDGKTNGGIFRGSTMFRRGISWINNANTFFFCMSKTNLVLISVVNSWYNTTNIIESFSTMTKQSYYIWF